MQRREARCAIFLLPSLAAAERPLADASLKKALGFAGSIDKINHLQSFTSSVIRGSSPRAVAKASQMCHRTVSAGL
jgi:hypothetical protein